VFQSVERRSGNEASHRSSGCYPQRVSSAPSTSTDRCAGRARDYTGSIRRATLRKAVRARHGADSYAPEHVVRHFKKKCMCTHSLSPNKSSPVNSAVVCFRDLHTAEERIAYASGPKRKRISPASAILAASPSLKTCSPHQRSTRPPFTTYRLLPFTNHAGGHLFRAPPSNIENAHPYLAISSPNLYSHL